MSANEAGGSSREKLNSLLFTLVFCESLMFVKENPYRKKSRIKIFYISNEPYVYEMPPSFYEISPMIKVSILAIFRQEYFIANKNKTRTCWC